MNFAEDSDQPVTKNAVHSYVGNMVPLGRPTMNFAAEPEAEGSEPDCGCPSNNQAKNPLPLPRMKF